MTTTTPFKHPLSMIILLLLLVVVVYHFLFRKLLLARIMEEDNKSEKVQSPYMDLKFTVISSLFAGMLFEIREEAATSVSKNAEHGFKAALSNIRSSPNKLRQCWLMKDAIRAGVAHGPISRVVGYGVFGATYTGINNWLVKNRGVDYTFNMGVAGTVSGASFCLMAFRSPYFTRPQSALLGAFLGAAVCFPVGLATQKLVDKDKERKALHLKQNEQRAIKHVAGATTKN